MSALSLFLHLLAVAGGVLCIALALLLAFFLLLLVLSAARRPGGPSA